MIAYTRGKVEKLLKIEFIRFCIVGGVGFVINLIILVGLTKAFKAPVVVAQLFGAEIALGTNFFLHHNWTYKDHHVTKDLKSLIIQFHVTTWPAILGSTAMVSLGVDTLHMSKLVALIISSAIALLWNFVWSKYVIWRHVSEANIEKIAG
jgi:putative flippase GtrA